MVWLRRSKDEPFEYHRDPDKTANIHDGDFFTLGDMGWMDEDGYLFLSGRTAELIISGGVNIYPAEVDAVLLEHPAVADVACVGVPDEEWGEAVKAVVEVRDGFAASAELERELIDVHTCPARALQVPALGRLRRRSPSLRDRQDLPPPRPRPLLALARPDAQFGRGIIRRV